MIRIKNLECWNIKIPLRFQFAQSNNVTAQSDSLILKMESENGWTGFGETCPRLYVTGESMESVKNDLSVVDSYLRQLQLHTLEDIRHLVSSTLPGKIGRSTICAIELALLDIWSKATEQDLISGLKGKCKLIHYSGIIPMVKIKYLEPVLEQLKFFGFRKVKLKVDTELEQNLEKIQLIRQILGPDVAIRLDANTGWTIEEAIRFIPLYLDHGVNSFEQILPKGEEPGLCKITRQFGEEAKIMVDESLTSVKEASFLAEHRFCNAFNLKISKNGGIFNTLKIYELAQQHGISCQLGAHFGETSLLTRANVVFSSLVDSLTANEGGFGTYLLSEDICDPGLQFDPEGKIDIAQWLEEHSGKILVDEVSLLKYSRSLNV